MAEGEREIGCVTCGRPMTEADLRAIELRRAVWLSNPGTDRGLVWPARCHSCYAAAERAASGPDGKMGVDGE